jgi:alkylation response protein AidB-like acyl-CoA dehydrogenase
MGPNGGLSTHLWVCPILKETLTRSSIRHPNTYTIFEGTSEIQRVIIARAISGVHIR